MKCKNCGNKVDKSGAFCEKCGTSVEKKSKTPLYIGLIAGIIVLAIVAVVGILVYNTGAYDRQIELGYELLNDGKYEEAILAFDKAIAIEEKRPEGYMGKAESMAHDPEMTPEKAEAIVEVLEEGYEKSGDKKVLEHKKEIGKIIRKNGFDLEANVVDNTGESDKDVNSEKADDGITLYSTDRKNITVTSEEVEEYISLGWMYREDYDKLLESYREQPYFAVDSDCYISSETEKISLAGDMDFAEFKEKYEDEIVSVGEIQDGLYSNFYVHTSDGDFYFIEGDDYNNKESYKLAGISTKSEKWTFGRGIKVGQNISEIDEILPSTPVPESYMEYRRYLFDENISALNSDPEGGDFFFSAKEFETVTSLYCGYMIGELYHQLELEHDNGIITSINMF